MSEFHPSAARTIAWTKGRDMTLMILSRSEIRYEAHWVMGASVVCPRKDCVRCKFETPTQRIAFFARELDNDSVRWLNLPAEPWEDAPHVNSLPDTRGLVVGVKRVGKRYVITPKGIRKPAKGEPDPSRDDAYRLVAKLHKLPIVRDLCGVSLEASFFHAADRKMRATCPA